MAKAESLGKEVIKLIRFDKSDELLSFLENHLKENSEDRVNILLSPELWKLICSHRAVSSARTLLDPEIFYPINPNIALGDGLGPLHLAAQSLCYDLTELFIDSGAQPDGYCDNDLAKLPLSLALEAICRNECVRDWTTQKSIFKLLYIFFLPELKESLDTVRLLASKTKRFQEITARCILNKELVQLVALLVVAWDKVTELGADQSIDDSFIGQLILDELEALTLKETKLLDRNCGSLLAPLNEHKATLESAWKVLKILEMSHVKFLEVLRVLHSSDPQPHQVPFQVAELVLFPHKIPIQPEDVYADDVKWWFFEDGDTYFNWSKTAQDLLRPKYRGYPHDKLALATLNHEHQLSSSYGQQARAASSAKYQGSLINGSRAFHSVSSLKAERNVPSSTQLRRGSVDKLARFSSFKQCAAVLMALRRGARHI